MSILQFRKRKIEKRTYDRDTQIPIIKANTCNSERVAGFRDKVTGQFEEVMFIRDNKDLDRFLEIYDIKEATIKTEY